MLQLLSDFASPRFLKFIMAGGIAALANFLSRILFSRCMDYASAIVLAYVVGMVTAFFLMKLFVFEPAAHRMQKQALYFSVVNIVAILQTLGISLMLAWYVLPALKVRYGQEEIAHAFGVCVPIFTSYLGHKYWSFAR